MLENGNPNLNIFLQSLEFLDEGLTVFDAELRLVAANRRFMEILDFPERLCVPGTRLAEFFRFNAERAEYGYGDVEDQIRERIDLARQFTAHKFRRRRPEGRVIEITGNPLPTGGFITTYRDVTAEENRADELNEELRVARDLQKSLLPSERRLARIEAGFGIATRALCRQADELGGDIWGLQPLDAGRIAFFVVDNVGHGIVASLHAFRVHTLVTQYFSDWQSLDGWVAWANTHLFNVLDVGEFAAYIFGTIDRDSRLLTFAAGGYPAFALGRLGVDADPTLVETKGMPLGILRDMVPAIHEVPLPENWVLLFYSDALIETEIARNRCLGEDELKAVFSQGCRRGSLERVFTTLCEVVEMWFPKGLADDLTLVCMAEAARDTREPARSKA